MSDRTILFAGGGTGGHIYPNVAIVECLRAMDVPFEPQFVVSNRAIDQTILDGEALSGTAVSTQPLALHPRRVLGFARSWMAGRREARQLIEQVQPVAVVATGGFVSGPAVREAHRAKLPIALMNLDAVPGKANRWMAKYATQVFSVYETPALKGARRIGLPLRVASVGPEDRAEARRVFGLDANRPVLMVTGGSQGARSLNRLPGVLLGRDAFRKAFANWQVLHVCGPGNRDDTRGAYQKVGFSAKVIEYCDRMGCAWRAATLAISRGGAGSVAEAWANHTPAIFYPYPGHRDQHQRLNAKPMVDAGGALVLEDLQDADANADTVAGPLMALMTDEAKLADMSAKLRESCPPAGSDTVAKWVAGFVSRADGSGAG